MTTYTLISATVGDHLELPGVEISDPDCPISYDDLSDDDAQWAEYNGYGADETELLYVVEGETTWPGWPTRTIAV